MVKTYTQEELSQLVEYSFFDVVNFVGTRYANDTIFKFYQGSTGAWMVKTGKQFQGDVWKSIAYFNHHLGTGKHIALTANNSYAWVCMFFAAVISGHVVVPVNPMLSASKLQQVIGQADIDMVLFQKEVFDQTLEIPSYDMATLFDCCMAYEGEIAFVEQDTHKMALLFGTSGVINDPKYVMLSQKNVMVTSVNGIHLLPIHKNHVTLSVLPLYHTYEISCGLFYHLLSGTTIVINNGLEHFKDNLQLHQPDFMTAVPSILASLDMLYKVEMSSKGTSVVSCLRYLFSGGAHLNDGLIQRFSQRGVFVMQGYGMTEFAAGISMSKASDAPQYHCGNPFYYSQVKIVEGEIWAKSPALTAGYYKNEHATRMAMEDGWLKTGDLGYLDEDNQLHVCGRIKNLITLDSGEKVYAEELEEMLGEIQGVGYCKVYQKGNQICAEVFAPQRSAHELDCAVACINKRLLPFQRIAKMIYLLEKPEVTALGKALRR